MKLLISEKFTLPKVYFISDREEIEEIPVGVPFIYGDEHVEPHLIRILEYEVLYQEALKSGYPFNFRKILRDYGYDDSKSFWYSEPIYMELSTEGVNLKKDVDADETLTHIGDKWGAYTQFIKDNSVYVDITKLKALNVFPVWLSIIEDAIHTNIHNFAVYNENMYNKKLDGMYGALDLTSPGKNLIVIDISGSIPKAVSSTCLSLSKNLMETFYADLLITGSKSTLYAYEDMYKLNVDDVYEENGMDNDQEYFRKIVSSDTRRYTTAIVFGDNHNPGQRWSNAYNSGSGTISLKDGKDLCKWEIEKLISFHTTSGNFEKNDRPIAGYGLWFNPKEVEHIEDWLKYLK